MTPEQEPYYLRHASVEQICDFLASKIRKARKQREESQSDFAERAGIPLRTFKRLETHGKGNLATFAKALVALERSQYLHLIFPQEVVPPKTPTLEERIRIIAIRNLTK